MEFMCALNDPGAPRYIGFVMSVVKLIISCNRGGSKTMLLCTCVVTNTGIVHIHRVSVTVQSNPI